MRILTHHAHTSYDAELAKTGHEFSVVGDQGQWDPLIRKLPDNWKFTEQPEGEFDCILINNHWAMFEKLKAFKGPMIFAIIADCSEGIFPEEIEERSSAVAFLAKEVSERWTMRDPAKKVVIEMGVDDSPFLPHVGDTRIVLTVGKRIGRRWDKGHCPYVTVNTFIPLSLVGSGNEDLPGALGVIPYEKLMDIYSHARVYFNPGPIIGISVAEAMMAGLPIVTFRPINLRNLIADGINGYVVDTVDGALLRLAKLLEDPELALNMGRVAQTSARDIFCSKKFISRWNNLFSRVTGK